MTNKEKNKRKPGTGMTLVGWTICMVITGSITTIAVIFRDGEMIFGGCFVLALIIGTLPMCIRNSHRE